MTIHGNGNSLAEYENLESVYPLSDEIQKRLDDVVSTLFARLDSDEVSYDTTAGTIEFPYEHGYSDLTGKKTWTRIFPDWVFIRVGEMDIDQEIKQAQPLILSALHKKARQRLGIEV